MREEPSEALVDLLGRLGLASVAQVRAERRHVHRLARDLPLFESVWVDALARARIVTPYQAAKLNAGRGEALKVGPFVLSSRLVSPGYANHYVAREIDTGRQVRLAVARLRPEQAADLPARLERLVSHSKELDTQYLAPITQAGVDGDSVWLASSHLEGLTADEWMVHNGRLPPPAAMEIARQMAAALVTLEKAGLCHGDLAAWNLILTRSGCIKLPHPGVRQLLRPEEGYAQTDLVPEGYDYLAPERIARGSPPAVASDVYACGCLWWHLLTGRAPRSGGTALAKLRAAQVAEIPGLTLLAPDTPQPLCAAVRASTRREPDERPESMARLAAMLGPPSHAGKLHLARSVSRPGQQPSPWVVSVSAARHSKQVPLWLAAIGGCLVVAAALMWVVPTSRPPLPVADIPAGPATSSAPPATVDTQPRPSPAEMPPVENDLAPASPAAGADTPGYATADDAGSRPSDPGRLVLDGGPVRIDSLALQPGQIVCGRPDRRPVVLVPPQGLVVEPEGVRFENVDFLWQAPDESWSAGIAPPDRAALVELRASGAEFHGCSFQASQRCSFPPVAIRWVHPVDRSRARRELPSGRVAMADCVIRGLRAGVDCRTAGAVAVELANVLYLGAGPMVTLDHCPAADEPIAMTLANVTVRGAGAVLECRYQQVPERPGKIRVQAAQCAFVSDRAAGLLSFVGPAEPLPILAELDWAGDGSLVSPGAAVAYWQQPDGRLQMLDDSAVSIAGLVRSEVEFAGPQEAGPAASRITRWQAPLRSPDPPGADPRRLTWTQ